MDQLVRTLVSGERKAFCISFLRQFVDLLAYYLQSKDELAAVLLRCTTDPWTEKNGVNTPVSEIVLISLFLLHVKFSTARKIGKDDGGTGLKLGCWCGGGEVIILADITPIQFG